MPEATVAIFICISASLPPPDRLDMAAIKAAPATITDAPPPKPLKSPTISGIEVIATFIAATAPITDPIAIPIMI